MAGLLTHLAISSLLFIIVIAIFKKLWYGFFIFIGQIIPDVIKFGITSVKLQTLNIDRIIQDSLFQELESLMNNYYTWVILGIIIILLSFSLYYFEAIKKHQFKQINWSYLLLVLGIIIHLMIDMLVIETSHWI